MKEYERLPGDIIVTGHNYGFVNGDIVHFKIGKTFPEITVRSQYGWEYGCQDTEEMEVKRK